MHVVLCLDKYTISGGPAAFAMKFVDECKRRDISYSFYDDYKQPWKQHEDCVVLCLGSVSNEPSLGKNVTKRDLLLRFKDAGIKIVLRLGAAWFWSDFPYEQFNLSIADTVDLADGVVFQSVFSYHTYLRFISHTPRGMLSDKPVKIIYNGSDTTVFYMDETNPIECRDNAICCCSYDWSPTKGLRNMINGVNNLLKNDEITLHIIGEKRVGECVKGFFEKTMKNIVLHGFLPPQCIDIVYNKCRAMLHLAYLDACPNAVIDAVTVGLPVICGSEGGTHEVAGVNKVVLPTKQFEFKGMPQAEIPTIDPDLIEEAVVEVLKSSPLVDNMPLNPVSSFTNCFESYLNFFGSLR